MHHTEMRTHNPFHDGELEYLTSSDSPERSSARDFIRNLFWSQPANKSALAAENTRIDALIEFVDMAKRRGGTR